MSQNSFTFNDNLSACFGAQDYHTKREIINLACPNIFLREA